MLLGDYAAAWRQSDAIDSRGRPDPNRFWDGETFHGKHVMVRCLHGLGDTLQFIRFLPRIRVEARTLTLEAQPSLMTLLAESFQLKSLGVDHLMTWGDAEPAWDTQIEINEVPRILRVEERDLAENVPYLTIRHKARERRQGEPFRVGLVWAAGDFNPARSIPAALFDSLFDLPEVRFYSLQGGAQITESARWDGQVTALTRPGSSILDLARFMLDLDLIVTVDTMAAHFAGALGQPTWILLQHTSDWRWMLQRMDTPWYPSARLFRQSSSGDWNSVLEAVKHELQRVSRQQRLPAD